MFVLKNRSIPFIAFLQATGLVVYLILISLFFNFMDSLIPDDTSQFYGPIIALLLFIISAVISGLLVLGRAGYLFWEKKYKESFTLIGYTVGWGIIYLVIFLVFVFLRK